MYVSNLPKTLQKEVLSLTKSEEFQKIYKEDKTLNELEQKREELEKKQEDVEDEHAHNYDLIELIRDQEDSRTCQLVVQYLLKQGKVEEVEKQNLIKKLKQEREEEVKSKNSIGKQITNAIWNILFTIILVIFPVFELVSYVNAKDNLWKQKYIESIQKWDKISLDSARKEYNKELKEAWGLQKIIAQSRTEKEQKIFDDVINKYKDIQKELYLLDNNKFDSYQRLIRQVYIYRTKFGELDAQKEFEIRNKIIEEAGK